MPEAVEGELCLLEELEVTLCMLLCILEAVEGRRCSLDVSEGAGGDALHAGGDALYTGGCGG